MFLFLYQAPGPLPEVRPKSLFSKKPVVPSRADDASLASREAAENVVAPSISQLPVARGHLITGNARYANHVVAETEFITDASRRVAMVREMTVYNCHFYILF